MIAIFTKPAESDFISWVKRAVALASLDNEQVEVVPLDGEGFIEVQGYVKVIKNAEACIIDLDHMDVMAYTVEMSSLGEGLSLELAQRGSAEQDRPDPSIIDPRLMLVTRRPLKAHQITEYFRGMYSAISANDGFTDEITDALVAWIKETVQATEPRVFISYRASQRAFASQVFELLKSKGALVWFDEFDIAPGDSIPEAINRGLFWCSHMILVVDETFFDSRWAKAEMESILYRHLSGRRVFFRGRDPGRPIIPLFLVDPTSQAIPPMLQRIRGVDCRTEDLSKAMDKVWHAITTIGPR